MEAQPRLRAAVRGLMIDPADRVLLVKLRWPTGWEGWVLPGGGIEAGESPVDALRREIDEETGVEGAFIGPPIVRRRHLSSSMIDGYDGQDEIIHLVPCRTSELRPALSPEELLAENVVDIRWWTLAEMAATDELLRPEGLLDLARHTLDHGVPPPDDLPTIDIAD